MKYKGSILIGQTRIPNEINVDLIKEFHKPESEKERITKIKETK